MKPILISGIQPTGRLHLGNYLGALKNFVELQNSGKYQCYFFIADYHSLTINFDPSKKQQEVLGVAQAYLAAGLDPEKSTIFIQSQVSESTELAWILNTITPMGELERMTQFKDKTQTVSKRIASISEKITSENSEKFSQFWANVGLFDYPVLMAADILLYGAEVVPVGDDQLQHLELTRELARKFNNRFGKTFMEPKPLLTKTPRVMSLDSPARKMSKTLPKGCLFLDDSEEEIEKKIKIAVTDSKNEIKYDKIGAKFYRKIAYDMYEDNMPNSAEINEVGAGISNLLEIYTALSGIPIEELEKKYRGRGYGQFKSDLAKIVADALRPFRIENSKLKT